MRVFLLLQTKEKRHAEAVSAALERRRIAKRQAAARVERQRVAAINISLNEKKQAKLKVRARLRLISRSDEIVILICSRPFLFFLLSPPLLLTLPTSHVFAALPPPPR